MKASTRLTSLTAVLALLAAGTLMSATPAFAQSTRAEVKAELARAQAAGELEFYRDYLPGIERFGRNEGAGLSRAEVKAELQRSIASGEQAALQRDSYSAPVVATGAGKTRAEVREELARAQASGELREMQLESYGSFPARAARAARPVATDVSAAATPTLR